ncbi:hypothetical protein BC834DRAFT_973564 [Gloeopeniophorella convolvens]|nr:hypothetical protein BC834DRAFT_973564 [Gloeopeniophorella convolvens]
MHMPLLSFVPNLVRYDVHAIRTLIESFVVRLREMEVVWVDYSGNAPQVVSLRAIISTLGRVLVEVEAEFKSWSHEDVQRFLRHGQGQPTQNHGFDANAAYYPPPPGPPPGRNHPLSPMSPRIGGAARPPVPGPSGYALPQESAYNAQQSASPNTFLYPIPARSQEPRPPERTVVQALPPDVLIAQETAVHLLEIINKAVSLIIQLNAL